MKSVTLKAIYTSSGEEVLVRINSGANLITFGNCSPGTCQGCDGFTITVDNISASLSGSNLVSMYGITNYQNVNDYVWVAQFSISSITLDISWATSGFSSVPGSFAPGTCTYDFRGQSYTSTSTYVGSNHPNECSVTYYFSNAPMFTAQSGDILYITGFTATAYDIIGTCA